MTNNSKWVHFIGIAGSAVGQIAIAYKNSGYIVTGSDKGLFPPMSTFLENSGIKIEIGYKKEHLQVEYYKNKYPETWTDVDKNIPDIVISQGAKGDLNEEYTFATENGISIKYFPDVISEHITIKDNSIVIAGTYGKTTITAMIATILKDAGYEPSYMFGGISLDLPASAKFKTDKSKYSVVEGDEYIVSRDNPISKFFLYSPKYLIITAAQWDHVDIFPTKEDYINNFKKLVEIIPEDGLIVYNENDSNVLEIIKNAKAETIPYRYLTHSEDFEINDSKENEDESNVKDDVLNIKLQLLGIHNLENALAATTLLLKLGIEKEVIIQSLSKFKGIKRRLEIRHANKSSLIIDDFGASPSKAKAAINSLKYQFPNKRIYAIFEPNLGSRTKLGLDEYHNVFDECESVYLPRFTNVQGDYLTNEELAEKLKSISIKAQAIDDDEKLIKQVVENLPDENWIIIFLGSHGFRGMIEGIISTVN